MKPDDDQCELLRRNSISLIGTQTFGLQFGKSAAYISFRNAFKVLASILYHDWGSDSSFVLALRS